MVHYTLRVELQNGKVLIYPISAAGKHALSNTLWNFSHGHEDNRPFPFVLFETVKQRYVMIATNCLARLAFCSDLRSHSPKEQRYYDNFNLLGKEPIIEEWEKDNGEAEIRVFGDDPPQALIYHRGLAPEDGYSNNPLTYTQLEEGCLDSLLIELEGDCPLRQFLFLTDDDGEENFVAVEQILVMEFDKNLLYNADVELEEEEEWFGEEEGLEEEDPQSGDENKNRPDDLPF